jgi:hypothetical protein
MLLLTALLIILFLAKMVSTKVQNGHFKVSTPLERKNWSLLTLNTLKQLLYT